MNKARPLSPHIQIYDLMKITSLTSMTHRLTGIALVGGSLLVVWWIMALAFGADAYEHFNVAAHAWYGQAVLVGFTWAFWYQLINGVRHLFWDMGLGFSLAVARKTGVLMFVLSIAATLASWYYILSV
jgi:succinate dehydrogenase / fumarate reductase cytochrome b subunit